MFPLSINNWIMVGLSVIALAGFGYGKYQHNQYIEFKQEIAVAVAKKEAENISIQKQSDLVNKGIKNEYEAKISALRNYYSSGLRNSSSGELSAIPQSAISIDGKAANLQLACAYTTQQLISLQDWIKAQAEIK
jgi:hypothetical protein